MSLPTLAPGVLRVASAVPDPPFEFERNGELAGLDVDLMKAICADLGLSSRPCRYEGSDFNGIFDGLADGSWDCVASGTTVTVDREKKADFCAPYLASGQSLVCNVERTPDIRSVDDLAGQIIGVQRGNTSEPVAERLKAEGKAADVRVISLPRGRGHAERSRGREDWRGDEAGPRHALADAAATNAAYRADGDHRGEDCDLRAARGQRSAGGAGCVPGPSRVERSARPSRRRVDVAMTARFAPTIIMPCPVSQLPPNL